MTVCGCLFIRTSKLTSKANTVNFNGFQAFRLEKLRQFSEESFLRFNFHRSGWLKLSIEGDVWLCSHRCLSSRHSRISRKKFRRKKLFFLLAQTLAFVQSQESAFILFYLFNSLAQEFSCMIALNFINFLLSLLETSSEHPWVGETNSLFFLLLFFEGLFGFSFKTLSLCLERCK